MIKTVSGSNFCCLNESSVVITAVTNRWFVSASYLQCHSTSIMTSQPDFTQEFRRVAPQPQWSKLFGGQVGHHSIQWWMYCSCATAVGWRERQRLATVIWQAARHTYQSIYFAIKGHRPLTNHTSSTNITTERKAKLYKVIRRLQQGRTFWWKKWSIAATELDVLLWQTLAKRCHVILSTGAHGVSDGPGCSDCTQLMTSPLNGSWMQSSTTTNCRLLHCATYFLLLHHVSCWSSSHSSASMPSEPCRSPAHVQRPTFTHRHTSNWRCSARVIISTTYL